MEKQRIEIQRLTVSELSFLSTKNSKLASTPTSLSYGYSAKTMLFLAIPDFSQTYICHSKYNLQKKLRDATSSIENVMGRRERLVSFCLLGRSGDR